MHNVVIGGGIAGLTSAILLAKKGTSEVLLVEANPTLGGLLRSFNYGENGKFDYGTHCLVDAYGEEINQILRPIFENGNWQVHERVRSDLSGVYYHRQLNDKTVFVDLKIFPQQDYDRYLSSYLDHIENKSKDAFAKTHFRNASEYLNNCFGTTIADEVFDPILYKIFGKHSSDLHPFSAKLIPLSRIVLFGETVAKEILNTTKLNSALAYPDQLNIPEKIWPDVRSFYPSSRGIDVVISALEIMALNLGCKIIKGKKITEVDTAEGKVRSLFIDEERIQVDHLVSSIPVIQLAKLFKVFDGVPNMDPPKHTVITNFVFESDAVRELNSRHYLYCYDSDRTILRLTNYNALTNENKGTVPITIESIHADVEQEDIAGDILRQLTEMAIVSKEPLFAKSEVLSYGFPLLTVRNMDFIDNLRGKIDALNLHNMKRVGVLNDDGIFFMKDVLTDVEQKILKMFRE